MATRSIPVLPAGRAPPDDIPNFAAVFDPAAPNGFSIRDVGFPDVGQFDVLVMIAAVGTAGRGISPLGLQKGYKGMTSCGISGPAIMVGHKVPTENRPRLNQLVAAHSFASATKNKVLGGGFQRFISVPFNQLLQIPDSIRFDQAATLPFTLHLIDRCFQDLGLEVGAGTPGNLIMGILIWGGPLILATTAIQIAHLTGFKVYAVVDMDDNEELRQKLKESKNGVRFFDHKKQNLVNDITDSSRDDGVIAMYGLCLNVLDTGDDLQPCVQVINNVSSHVRHCLTLSKTALSHLQDPSRAGRSTVRFLDPMSLTQVEQFYRYRRTWYSQQLESGALVPSAFYGVLYQTGPESAGAALRKDADDSMFLVHILVGK